MEMTKEFIPYEQALALKELGFDESCLAYYNNYKPKNNHPRGLVISGNQDHNIETEGDNLICSAPLYQQAFRWFREKYRLDGKPEYFLNNFYCFIINDMKQEDTSRRLFTEFPSYEEAELECLKKLIKIVTH